MSRWRIAIPFASPLVAVALVLVIALAGLASIAGEGAPDAAAAKPTLSAAAAPSTPESIHIPARRESTGQTGRENDSEGKGKGGKAKDPSREAARRRLR